MPELRWILFAIGAAVIVGIWFFGRRSRTPKRRPIDENLIDAVNDDLPELADVVEHGLSAKDIEALRGLRADDGRDTVVSRAPELILSLHVARRARPLDGNELFPALSDAGLEFGRMDIFHQVVDDGDEVFSVASMVEPGVFNPVQPDTLSTPGVTLFAVLPGPLAPSATFERMLSCARGLAAALGAEVLDESRSVLTRQTEAHLRERVATYEAKLRAFRRDG